MVYEFPKHFLHLAIKHWKGQYNSFCKNPSFLGKSVDAELLLIKSHILYLLTFQAYFDKFWKEHWLGVYVKIETKRVPVSGRD